MKRRIAVVVRPPADQARLEELRAAVAAVRSLGHRVSVRVTFEAGDTRRFARAASLAGWDVVVAAGGDGTINGVVNGLAAAGKDTALGVVPLGTANDFARGIGIPEDIEGALRAAATGRYACVDVARVNRRCFINVSTGGFGAEATQSAGRGIKRYLGPLAYIVQGAQKLMAFHPVVGSFTADGTPAYEGRFALFAVGNARQTGGGTPVAPRAEPGDGMLDLMVVGDVSRLDLVSLLPDLRAGTHLESPHVHYFRARRLVVRCDRDIAVNADGESVAGRLYTYDMLPRGMNVVLPS